MRTACASLLAIVVFCGTLLAQTNPVPFVSQPLVPESATPGGAGFTLTVNGTGFVSGSVVKWNGSARSTTFVSSSELHAAISASDIAAPNSAAVTVSSPAPGGGTSNVANFGVTLSAPSIRLLSRDITISKNFSVAPMVAGDFNADGNLDLAVSGNAFSGGSGRVFVLLGDGLGQFTHAGFAPIQIFAGQLITGDFNGDGKLDLAVINALNEISVLLGNGDGTFQPQRSFLTGISPVSLVAADFNQDGKLDIAVSNSTDNTVSVLLGKGDGTFSPHLDFPTGGVSPAGLVAGDFNGDGKLDLAVTEYLSDQVTILLGNGDGTFSFDNDLFAYGRPTSAVAADLNGDGKLDLVVPGGDNSGYRSWETEFLGNGDGSFQNNGRVASTQKYSEQSALVADMNGDGLPDLLTLQGLSGAASKVVVLLGDGTGGFQTTYGIASGYEPFGSPQIPVTGDFNHDGKLDVVTLSQRNSTMITLLSQSSIVLSPQTLNFGSQKIGVKSAPKSVTLTNAGVSQLAISGFLFQGNDHADFSQTNDCPAALPPGSSCTIQVSFKPSRQGNELAVLRVQDDGPRGGQNVPLKGVGTN